MSDASNDEQEESTDETNDDSVDIADASDGRYERVEEVGSGGIGTVYKGRHRELDRDVALKEISEVFEVLADLDRDEVVERFRDVSQDQAGIDHPNVVRIYDIETSSEYPFVVSEYAPNGNLQRLIGRTEQGEVWSVRKALQYFIQMLHGLDAAHEAGVVHGRIKPENAVLDAAGNAKLADFGLSRLVDLSDASQQVYVGVGPVAYNAPEELEDPTAWSKTADLYSLGILFYELLAGKVPGRRSPMPSTFADEVPGDLDPIFDRMTRDDPDERYPSAKAVLHDLYASDAIRSLLDRQSGVVFLRDPIEHGDELLVASEAAMAETAIREVEGVDSASATDRDDHAPEEAAAEPGGDETDGASEQSSDEPRAPESDEPESTPAEPQTEATTGGGEEVAEHETSTEPPGGTGADASEEASGSEFDESVNDTEQHARQPLDEEHAGELGDEGTNAETPSEMGDEGTDAEIPDEMDETGAEAESDSDLDGQELVDEVESDLDEAGTDLERDDAEAQPAFEEEFDEDEQAETESADEEMLGEAEDDVLDKLDEYGDMFEE